MPRLYGTIPLDLWEHLRNCSTVAKVIAAYYLSGRTSNALGLFSITRGTVTSDLNLKLKEVAKAEADLERMGFMRRCPDTHFVWLPGYLRDHPPQNPNVWKHVDGLARMIPSDFSYLDDLFQDLSPYLPHLPGLTKRFRDRLANVHGKPFTQTVCPNPPLNTEPEPEPQPEKTLNTRPAPTLKSTLYLKLLPQVPGARGMVDFSDPQNRNCHAHSKVLPVLEKRVGNTEKAWLVIDAARDPKNPKHSEADKVCRQIAKDQNVIWDNVPERSKVVQGSE